MREKRGVEDRLEKEKEDFISNRLHRPPIDRTDPPSTNRTGRSTNEKMLIRLYQWCSSRLPLSAARAAGSRLQSRSFVSITDLLTNFILARRGRTSRRSSSTAFARWWSALALLCTLNTRAGQQRPHVNCEEQSSCQALAEARVRVDGRETVDWCWQRSV